MDLAINFDVWYGGIFKVNSKSTYPKIIYVGGIKHEFKNVNFDKFNIGDLYALYHLCGGNKHNVRFFYRIPGIVIEYGLVSISEDRDIADMYGYYKDSDLVTIWIEETMPLPEMMLDPLGNVVIPQDFVNSEPIGYIEYVSQDHSSNPKISSPSSNPENAFEQNHTESHASDPNLQHASQPNDLEIFETFECSGPVFSETFDVSDQHLNQNHPIPNPNSEVPSNNPEASHEYHPEVSDSVPNFDVFTDIDEGISDHSEFDDSSDENYTLPPEISESSEDFYSDVPSDLMKDVEGSSDEDIFDKSMNTEGDGSSKEKGKRKLGEKRKANESEVDFDWCSEVDEEDELLSMNGSDEEGPRHPTFKEGQDMKKFRLVVGMKFKSAQEFREVLRDYSVREGYELLLKKNERARITGVCKNGCDWRIHASLVMGGPTFQIKTISGSHTCAKDHQNRLANYKYLGRRIEKIVRNNPDIKIDHLQNLIMRKCAIDVSKWKVIRAKRAAVQRIRGVDSLQYHLLWDYCETVCKFNPGSTLILKKKEDFEPPTFDKLYVCLNAMKSSFLAGCRPIIGLDGCFLKTVHGGQLLVAVGRDGNDNMVPIAFAVVQVENRENWTWFLSLLLEDIGGMGEDIWTFISDRQKGLVESLKELVPDSEHRFCLRHMYQNFKKKFRGVELKDLFWKAATTGNKNEFEEYMKKISLLDPKLNDSHETACEWLQKISPVHWARSHFSIGCLSDVVVNNLSESFNSYIMEARDKPTITMLECIRNKLMKRIQVKKAGMEKYSGQICPNILRRINKNKKYSRNFFAIYSGELEYQVQCLSAEGMVSQHVVDLVKKTCTCGMFQLCGYPCSHACTAIGQSRMKLDDFVHKCYSKDEYLNIYSNMIHAVPGQTDYCKTTWQPLNGPVYKRKKGRPQRLRRK